MMALEHGSEQPALAESGRPWMDWVGAVSLEGGQARLLDPTAPGFGVSLPPVLHVSPSEHTGSSLAEGLPEGHRPFIVQTGMGVDVHGSNPTKAAVRAIDEAIRHNSLTGLGHLLRSEDGAGLDWHRMRVLLTVACPLHEELDAEELCAALPHGEVELTTEAGGMLAETGVPGDRMLIALASVVVCIVDP